MVVTCCYLTSIFKINLFWQDSLQILSFMAINTRLRHTFCQAYIQCKSMQQLHFLTVNQMFNGYWYWLTPEYSGEPENSRKLWIVCPTPNLETIWFLDLFRLYLLNHQLHTEAKPGDHRTKTIWISSTKRPGTDAFFIVFGCGLPQYVDKVTSQRKAFCGRKLDHGPPLGFIVYLSLSCRSGAMLHWRLLLRKHSNHPQKWYRHYCRDL